MIMMPLFPDPDLVDVMHRDRHHRLATHRWLADVAPRRRAKTDAATPSRLRRRGRGHTEGLV